jgi:hypothetical protein
MYSKFLLSLKAAICFTNPDDPPPPQYLWIGEFCSTMKIVNLHSTELYTTTADIAWSLSE